MSFLIGFFIGYGIVLLGFFCHKKMLERKEMNAFFPERKPRLIVQGRIASEAKEQLEETVKADGWEVVFRP